MQHMKYQDVVHLLWVGKKWNIKTLIYYLKHCSKFQQSDMVVNCWLDTSDAYLMSSPTKGRHYVMNA